MDNYIFYQLNGQFEYHIGRCGWHSSSTRALFCCAVPLAALHMFPPYRCAGSERPAGSNGPNYFFPKMFELIVRVVGRWSRRWIPMLYSSSIRSRHLSLPTFLRLTLARGTCSVYSRCHSHGGDQKESTYISKSSKMKESFSYGHKIKHINALISILLYTQLLHAVHDEPLIWVAGPLCFIYLRYRLNIYTSSFLLLLILSMTACMWLICAMRDWSVYICGQWTLYDWTLE